MRRERRNISLGWAPDETRRGQLKDTWRLRTSVMESSTEIAGVGKD